MNDEAQRMIDKYGLYHILEANNISEADVIRILMDKGMIDEPRYNPYRLYYGDDYG